MRVVTLMGSPRTRGSTARILAEVEAHLATAHDVDRINVVDYDIHGCRGCDACQRVLDAPGCVQQDDVPALFERLMAADVLVYASPVYSWGFTAQLKALIDRHYGLVKWRGDDVVRSFLEGKAAALLVTCAGGAADNADTIQVAFQRQMDCAGCRIVGQYVVDRTTTPGEAVARAGDVIDRMVADIAAVVAGDARRRRDADG